MVSWFTPEAEMRISEAIARAEAKTSGEIVCTYSAETHRYTEWVLALAALAAFTLPLLLGLFGFGPSRWAALIGLWQGHQMGDLETVELYALAQVLTLLVATALLWWSPLAQRYAPLGMRQARVHDYALKQFLSRGIHLTKDRTGVMIHVSMQDHVVEVIADEAIYKKVPAQMWADTTAALLAGIKAGDTAQGFVDAIEMAGDILAAHFPPCADNPDELPNRLLLV